MKINKIELKNFKFHHNLSFPIKNNCLIYGENGSGKSSIYWALYSNFYYYKNKEIVNGTLSVRDKFLHRDYAGEDLGVNVSFDKGLNLNRKDEELENKEILKSSTIYFATEKILSGIVEGNFFDIINNVLIEHFPSLNHFEKVYDEIKADLRSLKDSALNDEIVKKRMEADIKCQKLLEELIPLDEINNIFEENLNEKNFKIEFSFKHSSIDTDKQFYNPNISIKVEGIDDKGDFTNHFNEARLKIIGISIYFALAKKYEQENSSIKLLVLDDFLTSLDMPNRKLIFQYILDSFKSYQKIILTHNIQFYNLMLELIRSMELGNEWDNKIIYSRIVDYKYVANIYDSSTSYIQDAKDSKDKNYLENCGNNLRKEYERIMHEFENLLSIGKKEAVNEIFKIILNTESKKANYKIYTDHNKLLYQIFTELKKIDKQMDKVIENYLNNISISRYQKFQLQKNLNKLNKSDDFSLRTIGKQIQEPIIRQILFEKCGLKKLILSIDKSEVDLTDTINILRKTGFYKSILMNSASHLNPNKEIYRKECENTIEILGDLNKKLVEFKNAR